MKSFRQYMNEKYEVKSITGKSKLSTDIEPKDRSFKNMPKDGKGNSKCKFQDWLGIPKNGAQGTNGKFYGWSHRAVYGFGVGDVIKKGSIGNKHDVNLDWDEKGKDFEPYTIKTEKEAQEHALRFMDEVS